MTDLPHIETGSVEFCRIRSCANDIADHAIVAYWTKRDKNIDTEYHRAQIVRALQRLADICGYELTPIK